MRFAVNLRSYVTAFSIIAVLLACANVLPVSAATPTPNGVTITPTQKELIVSSGLIHANTQVIVTNHTGKDLEATIRLVDFKSLDDTGGLSFAQAGVPTQKYGLANWMSLPNGNKVSLPNGQAATIPVVINNRFDLAPGGHYGAVVVTLGTDNSASNQTSFKQELVSLLFVTKHGGEDYALQLQSFSAHGGQGLPTAATMRFASTGNTHVVPRGYITVSAPDGTVLAKGTINQESDLIFPGTAKEFTTNLQTISSIKHAASYKITAYYRYDGQPNYTVTTIFINRYGWLLPAAITGVAIGSVLLLGWRYRRLFIRRKRYTI